MATELINLPPPTTCVDGFVGELESWNTGFEDLEELRV
jgi:hypothetical protein